MKETTNYKFKKIELTDSPPDITIHSGNFDVIDTELKKIEVKASGAGTNISDLQKEVDEHKADYEYQVTTVVGRQIRVTKQSSTNIVKFKLNTDIVSGTAITISLDGGSTSKPLRDFEGVAITELDKGYVEVIANASFFTLRPKGGKKIDDVNYIITSQNGQYAIPKGQHSGNGKVKAQFANLTSNNIAEDVDIGNVVGSLPTIFRDIYSFDSKQMVKTDSVIINKNISHAGSETLLFKNVTSKDFIIFITPILPNSDSATRIMVLRTDGTHAVTDNPMVFPKGKSYMLCRRNANDATLMDTIQVNIGGSNILKINWTTRNDRKTERGTWMRIYLNAYDSTGITTVHAKFDLYELQ